MYGKPVVASGSTRGAGVLLPGKTGLLLDDAGPGAIAAALRLLIDDPELRARLGAAAAEHARRSFDPARNARAVEDVYDTLLGIEAEPHAPAASWRRDQRAVELLRPRERHGGVGLANDVVPRGRAERGAPLRSVGERVAGASASAASSRTGTSIAVCPPWASSRFAGMSERTAARPHAMASSTAIEVPSEDGTETQTSAAR